MILYESKHFGGEQCIDIYENATTEFRVPHFHRSFELLYIYNGDADVFVDYQQVKLKSGEHLLIFPNQVHWFTQNTVTKSKLVIFSPDNIPDFYNCYKNKRPGNAVPAFDEDTRRQIVRNLVPENNIYLIKSALYAVCACAVNNTDFYDITDKTNEDLSHKLLLFIEKNFDKTCTLKLLSKKVGYSYEYLSWYFTEKLGASFTQILHLYRINRAVHLLKTSDDTITDIAFRCGFETIRSFHRGFKKQYNITPTQYRKNL